MSIIFSLDICDNSYRFVLQNNNNLIDYGADLGQTDIMLVEIEKFLTKNSITYENIAVLSVNCGPASFTLLKAVMTFAKGFHCCFPNKNIIVNNGFEILSHNENFDAVLMKMNENSCYVYDKTKYFYSNNLNNLKDIFLDTHNILINSNTIAIKLKEIGFKNVNVIENTVDKVVELNHKKFLKNDFTNNLKPLYIREPDINIRKK